MKTGFKVSLIGKLLLSAAFTATSILTYCQEESTCAENLKNAQVLFEKGQVELVSSMLSNCMKSGFKRDEELAAYKLLIQAYLFEDKLEQADSVMFSFLKKNPEYQLSPTDHSSLVYLYNTFKIKPVFQISAHVGTSVPFLTFLDPHSVSSEPVKSNYSVQALNLYASAEVKLPLSSKIELNFEGGYSKESFSKTEEILGLGISRYKEIIQRLEFPLSGTYNIAHYGKLTPFCRVGAGTALTLSSTAQAVLDDTGLIRFTSHTGPEIDRKDSRISADLFAQAGIGIKYKTARSFINLEIRSDFGLFDQVSYNSNSSGILSPSAMKLMHDDCFADDDFNLNNLRIIIGYSWIIYKPLKIK